MPDRYVALLDRRRVLYMEPRGSDVLVWQGIIQRGGVDFVIPPRAVGYDDLGQGVEAEGDDLARTIKKVLQHRR